MCVKNQFVLNMFHLHESSQSREEETGRHDPMRDKEETEKKKIKKSEINETRRE